MTAFTSSFSNSCCSQLQKWQTKAKVDHPFGCPPGSPAATEWMYEIARHQQQSPAAHAQACWAAYVSGQYSRARDLARQLRAVPEWYAAHLLSLVEAAVASPGPEPVRNLRTAGWVRPAGAQSSFERRRLPCRTCTNILTYYTIFSSFGFKKPNNSALGFFSTTFYFFKRIFRKKKAAPDRYS